MSARGSSPYCDLLRFETLAWSEGFARVSCDVSSSLLNRNGIVHGGVLLAMLDEAAGAAGVWCPIPGNERRSVTVDLNCRFIAPGRTGRIVAEAKVVGGGRSLFFCSSEARDENGTLLAFGSSSHRYRSGSHALEGMPAAATPPLRGPRQD